MPNQFTREQMLDYLKQRSALTKYSTQDILKKIAGARRAGGKVVFKGENLSGIDLSQQTIRGLFKQKRCKETNPPLWYSGDLKKESLSKKPDIIASSSDPGVSEVKSKRAIDLEGADFTNAILICANLEGADLTGADFEGAKLHYANLKNARLWDVNFKRTRLNFADLSGASMQNAYFSWSSLRGALMNNCLLYHTKFESTELSRHQIKEIWEEVRAKELVKQKKMRVEFMLMPQLLIIY